MLSPGSIPHRLSLAVLVGTALSSGTAPPAGAIVINGEGPATVTGIYDRFVVGTYPGAPVPNSAFIGAALDLSGIGWLATDSDRSFALVSPQYFVVATHYGPALGSILNFRGADGLLYAATVGLYHTLTYTGAGGPQSSDLTLGRLTTALPASVHPLSIFYRGATDISDSSSFDSYKLLSLLNYGHKGRMGTNRLDKVDEFSFSATGPATNIGLFYDRDLDAGETLLESGDSGSPTLAYENGVYGLIGTHSGVDTPHQLSVDAFVSYTPFVNQINGFLGADGQTLSFIPEPGTVLFGFVVLGMCGARCQRRARRNL